VNTPKNSSSKRRSLRRLLLLARLKSHCVRHWNLFKHSRKRLRHRKRLAKTAPKQLEILWSAARAYEKEGKEAAAWEEIASLSYQIAEVEIHNEERIEKSAHIATRFFVTILLVGNLWMWFHPIGSFLPLFKETFGPFKISGSIIQGIAVLIPLLFGGLVAKMDDWFRSLTIPRSLIAGVLVVVPVASMVPWVGGAAHWFHQSPYPLIAALFDGLFVGGVALAMVVVVILGTLFIAKLHLENRNWDVPLRAFIKESMQILDKILPSFPQDPEPMRRAVGRMMEENKQWLEAKTDALMKFREYLAQTPSSDPVAALKLTLERWTELSLLTKNRASPDPVIKALEGFMRHFVLNEIDGYSWGHPELMQSLAIRFGHMAHYVEVLGSRVSNGGNIEDCWIRRAYKERAAFWRNLQRCVLLPRTDTRDFLLHEVKRVLLLALAHDWGNMPLIELRDVPSLPWWKHMLNICRTILVGFLPLGGMFMLPSKVTILSATLSAILWTGSTIWLIVSLLTLLDDRFSEKLTSVKSILDIVRSSKDKSND